MPTTSDLMRQAILKRMGRDTTPDDATEQDYQNYVNQVNQRGAGEIVGEALAGLGDAVGRIAGQNSNSLGTLIANKQNSRRQQIADYLTKKKLGDENIAKLKEIADQESLLEKDDLEMKKYKLSKQKQAFDQEIENRKLDIEREKLKKERDSKIPEGQKEIDKKFGDIYADWVLKGESTGTQKQLNQLGEAAQDLETKNISGPILGHVPNWIKSVTNPKSIETQQKIEEAVQQGLRQVLGAQYTEKEGVNLLRRTFDPTLSEEVNLKRVKNTIRQLQGAAQAKDEAVKYFQQNGTLKGFKGKLITSGDEIDPNISDDIKNKVGRFTVEEIK